MRRGFGVAVFALASLIAPAPRCVAEEAPIREMSGSLVIRSSPGSASYPDARLISETIAELRERSGTFRDLLAVLAASPRMLALFAPSSSILPEHGFIGRTRFVVGPIRTMAFVDISVDRLHPQIRREAVAHELAHVAEVACLGPLDTDAALREEMRRQAGDAAGRPGVAFETGFALTVGRAVVRELGERTPSISQFAKFTRQFRLTSCPATASDDGFTIAGRLDVDADGPREPYR